jgi:hypothetical protein
MTSDFEALTADELYLLHREVAAVLRKKLEPRKMPWRSDCGKYSRPMNTRLRHHVGAIHGKSKIPESGSTVGNLVRTWQAAALARRAVEVRQTDRGLSN